MDEDVVWRTNKYGHRFPIKQTNDYMNNLIRNIKNYDDNDKKFKQENSNLLYENNVITENQKLAIEDYTSDYGLGSSSTINDVLNGTKQVSNDARSFIDQNVNYIDSCIKQSTNADMYVYRKIKINSKDLKVGDEINNKGFTSTSLYKSDASNIISGTGTIIKLKVSKGTKALYIGKNTSFARNEHELLFGRNHTVKITKIEKLFDKDGDFMNYEVLGELI